MSSHHFVKEGQEPALIIANGAMCSYDMLTSLMEWCPYIVVLDGAYQRVIDLQITPDVVIGDFDSIQSFEKKLNIEYLKMDSQEDTDLEKAIVFLVNKGYNDINVVWATGNRLDHTINNFATLAKHSNTRIVLYDDHSKAFVLPKKYAKHYNKHDALSLVPIHSSSGIHTTNLTYNLTNESLTFGQRSGTSNSALKSGIVEITYEDGVLVLIESKD
ncbi:MAG: thiamine diphosphokinase [Bacteroidetes bacterium]|nr:MAG: thiamine diphosphokinase [Bacteroidota bacterium]